MNFYNIPTKFFYEKDCVKKYGKEIKKYGSNFLIITGKSSQKNGSLADIKNVIKNSNFFIFSDVKENPDDKLVDFIVEKYKDENIDAVIGIGGGSPIDTAKAVAILLNNYNYKAKDLYSYPKLKDSKPVIAIPTTAGTGTEVTPYSVLTIEGRFKRGFKHYSIFPALSFVDYRYTLTLSPFYTISTALDALSHAVEGYISKRSTPITDLYALESIKLIKEYLPLIVEDLENEKFREKLMLASLLAGMVIAITGTTISHALGYYLTIKLNIPHGLATALFLQSEIEVANNKKSRDILEIMGNFDDFIAKLNVKLDLSQFSLEMIEEASFLVLKASHLKSTPGKYSFERIKSIYEKVKKSWNT